jgi:DNA-binding beta-propeller fold protein YncE
MKWLYFFIIINVSCNAQVTNGAIEKDRLTLISKINLPGVNGRIDHIAYDSVNHLAFIAALGNNTVEVININTDQLVHTITGLHEPQGIIYIASIKKLVVANGGNGECAFFDAETYKPAGIIRLKDDADNIRYNSTSNLLYVGYGNGAIAVIDPNSMQHITDIGLDGHPESFQISKKQNRVYVNVPDANEIEVADLSTNKVISKWKNANASSNFPMAFDDENDHLFIGYRNPAMLRMIDSKTGNEITTLSCSGDVDDIFYNFLDSLVFVSAGKGAVDVFRTHEKGLIKINQIKTSNGARTSLLLNTEKKILLAVPASSGNTAALWIYKIKRHEY